MKHLSTTTRLLPPASAWAIPLDTDEQRAVEAILEKRILPPLCEKMRQDEIPLENQPQVVLDWTCDRIQEYFDQMIWADIAPKRAAMGRWTSFMDGLGRLKTAHAEFRVVEKGKTGKIVVVASVQVCFRQSRHWSQLKTEAVIDRFVDPVETLRNKMPVLAASEPLKLTTQGSNP